MERILLVEDDGAIAMGLEYSLTQEGYQVTTRGDCPGALAAMEKENFDLYLLDLTLPGGSGYDLCRRAKQLGDSPVIFLTASGYKEDVLSALKLGAANYLKKPFYPEELLKRVAKEFEI